MSSPLLSWHAARHYLPPWSEIYEVSLVWPRNDVVFDRNIWALTGVVVYQIPGDFNADDSVDMADYVVWRSSLGTTSASDYQLRRDHFGEAAAAGLGMGSSASVPEPSLVILFLTALCMLRIYTRD